MRPGDYAALKSFYRSIGGMRPVTEEELEAGDIGYVIELYGKAIAAAEKRMWHESVTEWIDLYHQLYREKEVLLQAFGKDERHHIRVVIPVADRPLHLEACLHSLLDLCRTFHYGGVSNGEYGKVSVIVADDSRARENIQKHQRLTERFSEQGLRTSYFGLSQQLQQLDELAPAETDSTSGILGATDRSSFYHKGPSVMRNIAYLKLSEQQKPGQLYYFVDSDQEFRVSVQTDLGERDLYAINYFAELDRIFSQRDVSVLTGKVVGDPPVSPAVMAGNFLEDVIGFLQELSGKDATGSCQFHAVSPERRADAAYHDMAELFGFEPAQEPYPYRCDVPGAHDHRRCLQIFARKLNQFFYGEHPTRKSFYVHTDSELDVKPARTIYTGNYVFNAHGLKYFIPFAGLKLRMAGPVLGRIIKAEIGDAFVSANLPMLHKRTLEQTGRSEFRPGVMQEDRRVDLSDEFERQFYGDVMLFTMEKLAAAGYPQSLQSREQVEQLVESTECVIREQYQTKHKQIMRKLDLLEALFDDASKWWNQTAGLDEARQHFASFVHNIERNYSPDSSAHALVNSVENRIRRLSGIAAAIHAYPADRKAWEAVLAGQSCQSEG